MSAFSVCIPRIFNNIPNKKIVGTFEKLNMGKVKNMDIVWKTGRDGSSYKMAFVHFSAWNIQNSAARHFREQVEDPNVNAKLVYDDPWYWLVLPNNSNTIINSYKNRVENFIPDNAINGVSEWVQNKIAELEDELNCVYEELYQREYIPVKYRSECEWNQDIETGSINDDYMGNMSPMTIDELNCSTVNAPTYNNTSYTANVSPMTIDELNCSTNDDMSNDYSTYNENDELHKAPKYARVYPEDDALLSYPSESEDELYYNRMDYSNKHVINNTELALNEHKRWMTANYCGNN
jgi:hypothetical protein